MSALADELAKAKYSAMTALEAAAELNTLSESGPIPAIDVKRKLQLRGKWGSIADGAERHATDAVRQDCRALVDALADFNDFDMSDAEVSTAVSASLDGLIAASLLTADDKTAVLSLGDNKRSVGQVLGVRTPVRDSDVSKARAE